LDTCSILAQKDAGGAAELFLKERPKCLLHQKPFWLFL